MNCETVVAAAITRKNGCGRPQTPGGKIKQLEEAAIAAWLPDVVTPMREVWDRELRNAIFHSDYSLHGGEVRFKKDNRYTAYSDEQILH